MPGGHDDLPRAASRPSGGRQGRLPAFSHFRPLGGSSPEFSKPILLDSDSVRIIFIGGLFANTEGGLGLNKIYTGGSSL
jgi:hypothetical protein